MTRGVVIEPQVFKDRSVAGVSRREHADGRFRNSLRHILNMGARLRSCRLARHFAAVPAVTARLIRRTQSPYGGTMHPDLEAIVAADEEGRARVSTAEQRRNSTLDAVRNACDASIEARRAAALDALNAEIARIEAGGRSAVDEARKRNQEYLRLLAAAGERAFEDAVDHYTAIVLKP